VEQVQHISGLCYLFAKKFNTKLDPEKSRRGVSKKRGTQTVLLLDNLSAVHVQSKDDQVGEDVESSDTVEPVRVIEGDLLRYLHHPQDHGEVGSVFRICVSDQR
jgi:hypothetical protein